MLPGIQKNFENENAIVGKLNDCGGNKAGDPSSAILFMRSKKTYYSDKIAECGNSQIFLFKITKNLMGNKGEIILPSCSSDEHLVNKFSDEENYNH